MDDEFVYKQTKNKLIKLCQWVDNVGYYQVSFVSNGKKHYVRVHRLIAETMIPNNNNLPMVNHIDGNKLNNKINNLEWCNNSYNTQEAYDNGLYKSTYKCPIRATHKLTKKCYNFRSIRECSDTLCLNRKTLTSILKGNKINNYEYEFEYL